MGVGQQLLRGHLRWGLTAATLGLTTGALALAAGAPARGPVLLWLLAVLALLAGLRGVRTD
jgi:hypothetical protein